jgi:hypothetical protein
MRSRTLLATTARLLAVIVSAVFAGLAVAGGDERTGEESVSAQDAGLQEEVASLMSVHLRDIEVLSFGFAALAVLISAGGKIDGGGALDVIYILVLRLGPTVRCGKMDLRKPPRERDNEQLRALALCAAGSDCAIERHHFRRRYGVHKTHTCALFGCANLSFVDDSHRRSTCGLQALQALRFRTTYRLAVDADHAADASQCVGVSLTWVSPGCLH